MTFLVFQEVTNFFDGSSMDQASPIEGSHSTCCVQESILRLDCLFILLFWTLRVCHLLFHVGSGNLLIVSTHVVLAEDTLHLGDHFSPSEVLGLLLREVKHNVLLLWNYWVVQCL